MYRLNSLRMVRVSDLLVSQFFPCKQGHCNCWTLTMAVGHCGLPSKLQKCKSQKGKVLRKINIAMQCHLQESGLQRTTAKLVVSQIAPLSYLVFQCSIRMRLWMVFGHSVKSPFLSVSLTHQPFHFSSSTLRLHPSFKTSYRFSFYACCSEDNSASQLLSPLRGSR